MRALWSQRVFQGSFPGLYGIFEKWTFINVQNRFFFTKPRIVKFERL
jgi:hypothetical protein